MSDLVDKAHADAGLTLLHGVCDALAPPIPVLDGVVPHGQNPPYLLVYTTIRRPKLVDGQALNGSSAVFEVILDCHCVGLTAAAARAVGMQARTALLDAQPVVAGRSCGRLWQEEALPPNRDESLGYLVMDEIQQYRFRTNP